MSKFVGRIPLPPIVGANDVLAWDGTEFRPTRAVSVNPVFGAISAAALALAIGTGISDSNAIGFLPSTSTPGSEALTMYVGGVAGQVWTRNGAAVDVSGIGALTAASLKATGLATSGGVVFNSAAGLLQNSAGLTYAASALTVGDGTAGATIIANGLAGSGTKGLRISSAGLTRWQITMNNTAEGGSDSGSNLGFGAFSDAGAAIDTPITIFRATGGAIVLTRPLQPGSGSAAAPSYAFTTDTTTGFFRVSSGTISHVGAGAEYLRAGVAQFTYSRNTSVLLGTAPITNVGTITAHGADAAGCTLALCGYGNVGGIISRRANGTAAALTAGASGDSIFLLQVVGYEGTTPGFTSNRSAYTVDSSEAYTSAAQGTRHRFLVVTNGTTTANEALRIENSKSLLIGTTTDGMTAGGSLAIAQDLAHRGTNLGVFNTSPIAQKTGYGTPTGNSYQASFAAGSITLPNLAAQVAQLILDLKAYGLIGA
jgi:hypothetical protein